MRILITGGAGFVGSSLANRFLKDHYVKVIDNLSYGHISNLHAGVDFVHADVNDDVQAHFQDIDVVFHFAAIAPLPDNQKNPGNSVRNNIEGTARVLEFSRIAGVKHFIFASTSAVYENNDEQVMSESLNIDPDLVYATTKKCAELLCKSFFSCYNMPVTILRFFNVYGSHQDFQRQQPPLMGYIVRELKNDRVPMLHSDGEQRRDYVHVDDVCHMCETVMMNENSFGQTFNVCSGETCSVNEIYEICADQMKSNVKPQYRHASKLWSSYGNLFEGYYPLKSERVEKETNKFCAGSYQLAFKKLGWKPTIKFEMGIRQTVDAMLNTLEKND